MCLCVPLANGIANSSWSQSLESKLDWNRSGLAVNFWLVGGSSILLHPYDHPSCQGSNLVSIFGSHPLNYWTSKPNMFRSQSFSPRLQHATTTGRSLNSWDCVFRLGETLKQAKHKSMIVVPCCSHLTMVGTMMGSINISWSKLFPSWFPWCSTSEIALRGCRGPDNMPKAHGVKSGWLKWGINQQYWWIYVDINIINVWLRDWCGLILFGIVWINMDY